MPEKSARIFVGNKTAENFFLIKHASHNFNDQASLDLIVRKCMETFK